MIGLSIMDSKGREYSEEQIAKINDFIQGDMTMLLITKELAQAVVDSWRHDSDFAPSCIHCEALAYINTRYVFVAAHTPECIVTRAKLLLEQEWGIRS